MTRRKHSTAFKSRVALEAIQGDHTIAAIATRYNVHPTQIQSWKAIALRDLPSLYNKGSKESLISEQDLAILERKVGQLTIENDFLKKNWSRVQKKLENKW